MAEGEGDVDHKLAAEAGELMEDKALRGAPTILTDEELPFDSLASESKEASRGVNFADAPASAAEAKDSEAKAVGALDAPAGMSVEVGVKEGASAGALGGGEGPGGGAKGQGGEEAVAEAKQPSMALSASRESDLMNSSARHVWPEASGVSLMCDAKNHRIRAEADMKLLANRLQHLQVAEDRARKKIAETKARTGEIQGRKRVIQRRFNVGVLEAVSERKASTL